MSVVVLSFSDIPCDPRVDKMCRTLGRAGHEVVAIGYGRPEKAHGYKLHALTRPAPTLMHKLGVALRQCPANLLPALAPHLYWLNPAVQAMRRLGSGLSPKLIIANDLATLPLGAALKTEHQAKLIYDSHEYAVGEAAERPLWRFIFARYRHALESRFIHEADIVSTVSDGLAKALQNLHNLQATPTVIRNMPFYREVKRSGQPSPGNPIQILYHGLFLQDRGLDTLIDSVPLWREGVTLIMRGYGDPSYEALLKSKAQKAEGRILFPGPVATGQLIDQAACADIGILPFPTEGAQKMFNLPNKLFEYIMAGLCVISTPCEDIAHHIEAHGFGFVAKDASPRALADVVNNLSASDIATAQHKALAAAKDLNWDKESQTLLGLFETLRVVASGSTH